MIYQVKNLFVNINEKQIINDVSLDIFPGDFVVFVGKNGAGKTTLIKSMVGLQKISGGEIFFQNKPLSSWGDCLFQYVGVVLQNPDHQIFSLSVQEEIEFVLNNFNIKNKNVLDELKTFNFEKFKDVVPFLLSEGEKKKLCIISILAHSPIMLILDEPFSTLDWQERTIMFRFLKTINQNRTILMTTHDLNIAKLFPRIVVLDKGKIIKDGDFLKVRPTLQKLGLMNNDS